MQAQTKATTRPYGTKQRSSACCASTLAWLPGGVWLPGSLACARQTAHNINAHLQQASYGGSHACMMQGGIPREAGRPM
jgi:hypothetical protein